MEKFKASSSRVEVNGETILSFVNALSSYKESRLERLKSYGIVDPKSGQWYSQQAWLNAFKDVATSLGNTTLRLIGKTIPNSAIFPPGITTTKQAFEMLNAAYKSNHRGGEIGYYRLIAYDEAKKTLTMECDTPYPEEFDAGILEGLWQKFKPNGVIKQAKVTMENKDNVVVYTLTW